MFYERLVFIQVIFFSISVSDSVRKLSSPIVFVCTRPIRIRIMMVMMTIQTTRDTMNIVHSNFQAHLLYCSHLIANQLEWLWLMQCMNDDIDLTYFQLFMFIDMNRTPSITHTYMYTTPFRMPVQWHGQTTGGIFPYNVRPNMSSTDNICY